MFVYLKISHRFHWFDQPDEDRKIHKNAIPTSAGLIFMTPMVLAFLLMQAGFPSHSYAIGLVLWPELFETREVYMYVDDEGHTVIDEARDPNCKIATDIDVDEFSKRLMDLYMKQNYKRSSD